LKIKAYHISRFKNRDSILKNGLIPKGKNSGLIQYPPSIFFSIDINDLAYDYVDFEYVDCWEFEIEYSKIKSDTFSYSKSHYYINEPIPPSDIKLIPHKSIQE